MTKRLRYLHGLVPVLLFLVSMTTALAGIFEFTEMGASGSAVGKRFEIGAAGKVFLQDAFVAVPGLDLNGSMIGTAGRISLAQLPDGMTVAFTSRVRTGGETVELEYDLRNSGNQTYAGLRFSYYLDLEIGEETNRFYSGTINSSNGSGSQNPE